MAKLFACQTFRDVTAMAQQVFGGVGFTLEYDIQLYFRRAKQLQISWWNDRYLEELVAAQVLDAAHPLTSIRHLTRAYDSQLPDAPGRREGQSLVWSQLATRVWLTLMPTRLFSIISTAGSMSSV